MLKYWQEQECFLCCIRQLCVMQAGVWHEEGVLEVLLVRQSLRPCLGEVLSAERQGWIDIPWVPIWRTHLGAWYAWLANDITQVQTESKQDFNGEGKWLLKYIARGNSGFSRMLHFCVEVDSGNAGLQRSLSFAFYSQSISVFSLSEALWDGSCDCCVHCRHQSGNGLKLPPSFTWSTTH